MNAVSEDAGPEQMEPDARWISELLSTAAETHVADSRRVRASVHEITRNARRARRRALVLPLRLAGIPAGITAAVLCATVAVAVTATIDTEAPRPHSGSTAAAGPSAAAEATQSPVSKQAAPTIAGTSASAPGGASVVSATATLDTSGNADWSQEDVWVALAKPTAGFQLTVKVSRSAQPVSTGTWMTYDTDLFDVSVKSQSGAVIYKFQLKSGRILPAGTAEFAVRFSHGPEYKPEDDTYYLSVYTDKADGSVSGISYGPFPAR
jgi:hypothetical protein